MVIILLLISFTALVSTVLVLIPETVAADADDAENETASNIQDGCKHRIVEYDLRFNILLCATN